MKLIAVVVALSLLAPPLRADAISPRQALAAKLAAIVDQPRFAGASWGLEVRNVRTGEVVYSRNARKQMKPASALKLLPTAAALDAYGPDARLSTTVQASGSLDASGSLSGDLYLVGAGDPNLSGRFTGGRVTAAFEALADRLRSAGVRRVEGRVVGNDGLFRGDRRGDDWSWGDLVWWYGAEVSALSFNDNCVDVTVAPGARAGDQVAVVTSPPSSYYRIVSTATTSAAGTPKELVLDRPLGGNVIHLSGTYPLGHAPQEMSVALDDPARWAATVFTEVLRARGIAVVGDAVSDHASLPEGLRTLAVHESVPMVDMIAAVNKPSQNLHAELMLRLAGLKAGTGGTAEGGHEAIGRLLERFGFTSQGWALQDGSGLSRSNLIAPHELVDLLAAMHRHPAAAAFRASLPIAGVDGSLRNRLKGTPAEGRLFAKTGTIRHVNALAGYATTADGEPVAFAIIANHHTGPSSDTVGAIDEICRTIVGWRTR